MRSTRHSNAAEGIVNWLAIEYEKDVGLEGGSHVLRFFVQPEVKFPRKDPDGQFQWTSSDAVHPFWVIKRQSEETQQWNVELVQHEVTTVVACEFEGRAHRRYCQSDRAMHRQLESHCCR